MTDTPIDLRHSGPITLLIGAGMSAESGVPTYRGQGGIWGQYDYHEVACQAAFERQPAAVLDFHETRRQAVLACSPHAGHRHIAALQTAHPGQLRVVTQNIDGMLQRAGVRVDAELHGSLWRARCTAHGVTPDADAGPYRHRRCPRCGEWMRPDITWFEDVVDEAVFARAGALIFDSEWLIAIGTSAVVYPAASFLPAARARGVRLAEINPAPSDLPGFDRRLALPASTGLPQLLQGGVTSA